MTDVQSRAPLRLAVPAPYLRVDNAERAIAFYSAAFGAREIVRLVEPGGRVAHAELGFGVNGEVSVMLSEEYPEQGLRAPRSLGGTPVALQLYVEDVDAVCARAVAAGATLVREPADDPFGDRAAKLLDPSGHEWMVATRLETISPAEMLARFGKFFGEVPSDQLGPSPS